jgi:uncharacterized protein YndB with AHSA1/START domain
MTGRSATHASFTLERVYDASPARVFAAWASAEAKAQWFFGTGEWREIARDLDFRVGGRERLSGGRPGGPPHIFDSIYHDIVPDRRIIFSYDMHIGERRISVSLATLELKPAKAGTNLTYTEQGAFLDGYDDAGSRERGTNVLLDQLGRALARPHGRH